MEKCIKGIQECDLNGGLIGNCPYKGILALLKGQEVTQKDGYNLQELWKRARSGETLNETELNFLLADWDERNIFKQQQEGR